MHVQNALCVAAIQNVWISGLGRFKSFKYKQYKYLLLRCGKWTTYSSFPDMKANVWQLLADRLEKVTDPFPHTYMGTLILGLSKCSIWTGVCGEKASVELDGHRLSREEH